MDELGIDLLPHQGAGASRACVVCKEFGFCVLNVKGHPKERHFLCKVVLQDMLQYSKSELKEAFEQNVYVCFDCANYAYKVYKRRSA